jgi:hypothetical protein
MFGQNNLDLLNAKAYATHFAEIFEATDFQPCDVTDGREFVAFANVLRCHVGDAEAIAQDRSSNFKAAALTMNFMVPAFVRRERRDHSYQFKA